MYPGFHAGIQPDTTGKLHKSRLRAEYLAARA